MKLTQLIVLTTAMTLAACAKGKDSSPAEKVFGNRLMAPGECDGPTPSDATVLGKWRIQSPPEDQDVTDASEFTFNPDSMNLVVTCINKQASAVANITVPVRLSEGAIYVLQAARDEQRGQDNAGNSVSCRADVPIATIQYQLVGHCLKLISGGQSVFAVR